MLDPREKEGSGGRKEVSEGQSEETGLVFYVNVAKIETSSEEWVL